MEAVKDEFNVFTNIVLSPNTMDLFLIRSSIFNALKTFLPQCKGVLLDIGCGEMPYKEMIIKNSKITTYIGMDIENPKYQANTKPDIFWDGKKIPLPDNSVDCAISTELFEHLPDIDAVLKEVIRVLRPNGRLFFTVPFLWPLHDNPQDEYRYTPFSLKRHLENAGFTEINIEAMGGWDASLAQMIGLWVRRSPMTSEERARFTELIYPFYKELLEREKRSKTITYEDMCSSSIMITGLTGTALKRDDKYETIQSLLDKAKYDEAFENDFSNSLSPDEIKRYAVHKNEDIYLCTKPAQDIKNTPVLAIVCPQVGAVSETFIRKHIEFLAPFKTVVLTGAIIDDSWFNGPIKKIPIEMGHYKFAPNLERDIIDFLRGHKVTHILCEFGCIGGAVIDLNHRLLHLPVYVHFHGQDASEFLRRPDIVSYYRWMGGVVNGVIAVSKPMKKRLVDIGIPTEKISIVHYGVNIPDTTASPEKGPCCRFIAVTRLVAKKGIMYLLKAFLKVYSKNPNITLEIIGDGPMRNEIEDFIKENKLTGIVTLHGSKPNEFVLEKLKESSVYVQHSITDPATGNAEGLPNSILEASACGLPVIATNHEGIPEAVEHGVTGFLVDEGDWDKMAEYMLKLSLDGNLRKSMGISARRKMIQDGFTLEKMIQKLRDLMGLNAVKANENTQIRVEVLHRHLRKILFVNHNIYPYELSGTPLSTYNQALEMKKRGLDVAVLVPSPDVKREFAKEYRDGITLYKVPRIEKYKAFFADVNREELETYLSTIKKIIAEFSPQVVHINDYVWMPIEIVRCFKENGCMVIRNVCNMEELCPFVTLVVVEQDKVSLCQGPKNPRKCSTCYITATDLKEKTSDFTFLEELYRLKFQKKWNILESVYNTCVDGVIFTTEEFKSYFKQFIPLANKKIKVIPRGMKFDCNARPQKTRVAKNMIRFGFFGNLLPSKGIDMLLSCFKELSLKFKNFRLDIFGPSYSYSAWIENLEALYPTRIKYHGTFEPKDLEKIADLIDVAIIPSYFETYNRVVREMLYFGVPVIVTDFFGASIVENEVNGLKIPVGDRESLQKSMERFIQNPGLVEKLSVGAIQTKIPSIEDEIEEILKFYVDLKGNVENLTHLKKKFIHTIAFYQAQYHNPIPIPENDNWWGEGFTEWTNVRSAVPLFDAHIQPRIPTELGWYNLLDIDVIKKQVKLAREHGIYGFCFYHYWFNGKLLLEKPLENFLNCSEIDFPFCLCWANEDWTRAWDGRSGEILIKQEYSEEDDLSHIFYLIPFLKDERYIKVDGKPLLLVYRISKLPDPLKTTTIWREEAKKAGIDELFLCSVENFPEDRKDPRPFGFDASIEFQPDFVNIGDPLPPKEYNGVKVYDYRQVVAKMLQKEQADYPRFFCVFPQWDNTPRRKKDGLAIINSNPDTYGYWLAESIRRTLKAFPEGRRLVFINAWNEWGEGNMLEPDSVWGRRYLEVTKKAVSDYEKFDPLQEKLEQIERLSENGELEEAKKLALSLIEDHPYHPMLLNELAGIFYREGDKTNAMIYLKKAAALKPDDILILKNLGNIYIELGKNVEAEKMFEKVITIDPEDSESQQILSFLRHEHEKKDVNKPLVSIVIPVLNNLDFTIRCIDSILKCETEIHYEVIIVDNGFTDEIMDYFTSLKNPSVRYVQYEENLGPVGSCNKAVEEAQGDFIFLLVPEIQPRGDWLKPMLELVSENRATAVTSKIVGHDERIVEAGFSVFEKEKLVGNGEGHNKNESQYNHACNAKSGSRYSIFISKKDWIESGGLDSRYSSIHIALVDMGLNLISMGKQILYQPQSEFSIQVTGKEELGKRRPQILFDFSNQVENETRSKVLVLGVYLAEQLNFIEDIVERFAESKNHDVEQYWISIGSERVDKKVQEVTVKVVYDRTPKFVLMNELLSQKNLSEYEYIIIADDDIILPYGFLDEFLHLQSKYEFVLAQPARTTNSYIDHPIVMQQRGVIARQTKFVEIGPLFSVHNSIYDFIFPFDTISPMGWGYENYWSYELSRRGYKMGIIDNTPVDHSIRKPVKNYEWSEADRQRRIYLQKYPHLKYEDCFVVTDVISLRG